MYVEGLNLVIKLIIMPADGLAPWGARASAGTVITWKLNIFPFKVFSLPMIVYHLYGLNDI